MIAVECPRHRARVLLSEGNIRSLHQGRHGLEIRYRCTCGHEGTWAARPMPTLEAVAG